MTDDFSRAATGYGRGGVVARVRVPKSIADQFYNAKGGPSRNQEEWLFNTEKGINSINQTLEIMPTIKAIRLWW
jgi:hypothetical protein